MTGTRTRRSTRDGAPPRPAPVKRPRQESAVGVFDQSLKHLLHQRPQDFIGFGLGRRTVRVLRPVEAALPSKGRDVDGGYVIELEPAQPCIAHTEFHRRHQDRDQLALDVGEAQLRLHRREGLSVLTHVWDLYGSPDDPVLEEHELVVGLKLGKLEATRCQYVRVNLRGLGWRELFEQAPVTLWALAPLTRDGASAHAVREARDELLERSGLSAAVLADRLATLWFLAEAEGVASNMIKELITEDMLMRSELYQSIIEKGRKQGLDQGRLLSLRKTVEKVLLRRGGALDPQVRARLKTETALRLVESWCNEALDVVDEAGAALLAARIKKSSR